MQAFFVGEMGEFEGDDDAVEDEGGAEAGAEAEEEHFAAAVSAERLHGGIVDEADGLAEFFLVGEVDPAGGEVVGFGEGTVVCDGAGIADGDGVVVPGGRGGKNLLGHLRGVHGGAGDDLDGDEIVGGGDLDVGSADVDDEDFH